MTTDRQPQARATDRFAPSGLDLAEMIENARQIIGGDTDACVDYTEDHLAVIRANGYGNMPVIGELDGIADNVP